MSTTVYQKLFEPIRARIFNHWSRKQHYIWAPKFVWPTGEIYRCRLHAVSPLVCKAPTTENREIWSSGRSEWLIERPSPFHFISKFERRHYCMYAWQYSMLIIRYPWFSLSLCRLHDSPNTMTSHGSLGQRLLAKATVTSSTEESGRARQTSGCGRTGSLWEVGRPSRDHLSEKTLT